MAILGPFLVMIWLLHEIISQKRGSDCHFELLSVSESELDQNLWHDISFYHAWKMHHFMASLPKWVLTPPKETSSHIFKMVIFPKFFWAFMKHIIRWNTGKKLDSFPELFTNMIFDYSFVCFFTHKTIHKVRNL